MIIDLNEDEWEFLQRKVTQDVAFHELKDPSFRSLNKTDYLIAKRLLEKFIKEKKCTL